MRPRAFRPSGYSLRKASGGENPAHERPPRIRIWCEGTAPHAVYPDDIDGALADQLGRQQGIAITRGRLSDPHTPNLRLVVQKYRIL